MVVLKPNVVKGGRAIGLGNNFYLMKGRTHSKGGIDIGKNPKTGLEVENNEVMQVSPQGVRVFSAQPILGGISPAQYILGGANPNRVFAAQEQWKKVNKINDDGTKKARFGKEEIVAKRYNSAYKALIKNGYTDKDAERLVPFIISQSILESGYVDKDDNNYGGYLKNGKRIKYDSEEEFYNSHINNLKNKWPTIFNAKDIEDYLRIIHGGDIKEGKIWDYAPKEENNNYDNRVKSVYNKINNYIDIYRKNYKDKNFITKLDPIEEQEFQKWYKSQAIINGTSLNSDDKEHYYDYRGFWKENKGKLNIGHFSDKYKIPGHPTFSEESVYSQPIVKGGKWDYIYTPVKEEKFVPSNYNLNYKFGGRKIAQGGTYIVQPGDTLSLISKRLTGDMKNYHTIAQQNNIENPDIIKVGQKLTIPDKFDKPLKLSEIPTKNRVNIIDNYSPNYNYIVEGDKVYYALKGRDYWVDISDNNKARKNLLDFLAKNYNFKGYEDNEKEIYDKILNNNFDYNSYRLEQQRKSIYGEKQKAILKTKPVVKQNYNRLPVSRFEDIPIVEETNVISNNNVVKQNIEQKESDANKNASYYYNLVKNGIKRKVEKLLPNKEKSTNLIIPEEIKDSEYDLIPQSFTGDTVKVNNRQYILPENLDANSYIYGARNRGDNKELDSEGAPITIFNNFKDYDDSVNKNNTYIGIDSEGNLKVGNGDIFKKGDKLARSYSNKVYSFAHNEDGSYRTKDDAAHGNRGRGVPIVNVENDKGDLVQGSLNILFGRGENKGTTYGNVTGGRVLVRVGNELRLLSGSVKDIESGFESMKKRQGQDFGIFYTLDNGSYNRGLRTYDKKITKLDLARYDSQNTGGGNFLYIKGNKPQKFSQDTVKTPNIRTVESKSYKEGHPLENSNEGIVLHYTAFDNDDNLEGVTKHFLNPKTEASSHVVIGKDGRRRIFADKNAVTFHAGESFHNGKFNVNDFMHGVEFQNNGIDKLTKEQIDSFIEYITPLIREHNIRLEDIVTHETVRSNYNKYTNKRKAPEKHDLTFEQYKQVMDALKEKLYYKKQYKYGGIHIKPSKRGTFTAAAKKHGMSVQGFASKVLANKGKYSSAMIKKANFARNASKWKHKEFGGDMDFNYWITKDNIYKLGGRKKGQWGLQDYSNSFKVNLQPFNPSPVTSTNVNNSLSLGIPNLIGAGLNLVGNVASYFINRRALKSMQAPIAPSAPTPLRAENLETRVSTAAQEAALRENIAKQENLIASNLSSSRSRLNAVNAVRNQGIGLYNQLQERKQNVQTELINRAKLNRQQINSQNTLLANQYKDNVTNWRNSVIDFENKRRDALSENAIQHLIQGPIDAIAGERGYFANLENNKRYRITAFLNAIGNPNAVGAIKSGEFLPLARQFGLTENDLKRFGLM